MKATCGRAKVRRLLAIIPVLVYWPGIFILSHIKIPELVYRARVSDKTLHFAAYLILAFLLWLAVRPFEKVKWRRKSAWITVLFMAAYAIADEVIQGFVGRSCDGMDFVADMAGGIFGLVILTFLSFRAAALLVTATVIFLLTNLAKANVSKLIPVTDAVFHLLAYGFLTLLWIWNLTDVRWVKRSAVRGVAAGLLGPWIFLGAVKSFSLLTGREFAGRTVIIGAAAVAVMTAGIYLVRSIGSRFR